MYCICVVANALSKTCFLCLNVCDYFVFVFVWYFVCFDCMVYWWFVVPFGKMFSLENVFWVAFKIMPSKTYLGPLFVLPHVSWVLSNNWESCVVFIWSVMCKWWVTSSSWISRKGCCDLFKCLHVSPTFVMSQTFGVFCLNVCMFCICVVTILLWILFE